MLRLAAHLAVFTLAVQLAGAQDPAPMPRTVAPADAAATARIDVLKKEAYLTPPKEIADAVLAARNEIVALTNLSPNGKVFLIAKRDGLPALERLGCPCVHLAEMAFDPVAHRARSTWVTSSESFELFFPADKSTVKVKSPTGARVSDPVWSPDGNRVAFFALYPDCTHVCVADATTGECKQVTKTPVLATLVSSLQWSRDGKQLQTILLPDDGKRKAPNLGVATEPKVRVARDGKDPSRTYRYLLESPYEAALLEHLCTGQLALVNVADGKVTKVGEPAMIRSVSTAPGEHSYRVGTVKKPFSYYAPFTRFGSTEGIWSAEGKSLFVLQDRNLRETEPTPPTTPTTTAPVPGKGGRTGGAAAKAGAKSPTDPPADPPTDPTQPPPPVTNPDDPLTPRADPIDPNGRRDLTWRPDGKGMTYLQLEPENKDKKEEARKDRVMQWTTPFGKDDAKVVFESPTRITGVQWSDDCRWLFVVQTLEGQRTITAIDQGDKKSYVVQKGGEGFGGGKGGFGKKGGKQEDDEQPPAGLRPGGAPAAIGLMSRAIGGGVNVVRISSKGEVYVSGSTREGGNTRPTIDAIDIKTAKKRRVFEGKSDLTETIDAVDGNDITKVYTTRQKSNVVPDSFVTDVATGKSEQLTKNVDKTPWFHELKTERFKVTRADGFKFNVKVTTSPKATGKQPALFWIYPREFTDQADYDAKAGRGTGGAAAALPGRFASPGPRSVAILTLAGYAVVEPDVPIVGPAGRMNDNYVHDLRNSLWAAIDECDKRGIIDRDRLACGGHSYGAFSTANALAHTPFFKAGIAGDGCYNRTLTSMSFQSERRHLWDARETYLEMSPLLWANRVNGALLMYHGMEDANVGTNPVNSEALFAALDGLGKDASLYMYPYEGHGPLARETNLDMWARWIAWLDTYVKNPKKK